MDPSIATLYRDHDNLRKVLSLLEQSLVDICRGYLKDYRTLQHIIVYIQDYLELVHHPAEDVMFAVLFEHDIRHLEFSDKVKTLVKAHSELEVITRSASEAVESAIGRPDHDVADMVSSLSTLLSRQRSHIQFEEVYIFPYINKYLSSEDWEKIVALVPDDEDPVFGSIPRKEFEQILNAIQARGYG